MTADYAEWTDRRTGLVHWRSSGSGTQRILPDLNSDLMFWHGELQIAGYDTCAHDFERGLGETTYGVRLPAGMLPYLVQDSAITAADARVPIPLQRGDSRLPRLIEELRRADDPSQALSEIAGYLLGLADPDPGTSRAAEGILVLAGQHAAVATIANRLGWTERKLHRFCIDTFGTSASVLKSLCRFRAASQLLASGTRPADVAALAGYTDQSHLTRHIKRFASTTPAAWT